MKIEIIKLDSRAEPPKRERPYDGAYDLKAIEAVYIGPGERALVSTGLAIALPEGYVALILARSGLALKKGLAPANAPGLIDANYRGEIKIIAENRGGEPCVIEAGERIAQMLIIAAPLDIELKLVDELAESPDDRGSQGFGSSG